MATGGMRNQPWECGRLLITTIIILSADQVQAVRERLQLVSVQGRI